MRRSDQTARELYEDIRKNPKRRPYGFGERPIVVNVDIQKAFTLEDEYSSAYSSENNQIGHVNDLVAAARACHAPIVWTYVAYMESGEDCGVFGTRSDHPDALQNIKIGSRRAELDDRLHVDQQRDALINKRGASAFFQTNLASLLIWHRIDTVIVTGGSTSGCVRATVVDSLQSGYRTIVPEECVCDRDESPHYANLYDMAMKYADVLPVSDVIAYLSRRTPSNNV